MSFTIDGTSASTLNIKLKSGYTEPGTPNIRKRELTVPGKAGKYDFGSEYSDRVFELPLVTLDTTTNAEVQEVIRELADTLTDNNGDPKEVELSFSKESDKHYKVKLNESMGITRSPGKIGEINLPLVATEPYAFASKTTNTVSITSSPQVFSVQNSGSAPTPVTITITNTGSNTVSGFTIKTA